MGWNQSLRSMAVGYLTILSNMLLRSSYINKFQNLNKTPQSKIPTCIYKNYRIYSNNNRQQNHQGVKKTAYEIYPNLLSRG